MPARQFVGPNGARFTVTPGVAVTEAYIQARIDAGEWTPVEPPEPSSSQRKTRGKPATASNPD